MDRFSNDLRSEQNAKVLAFEILGHARDSLTATSRSCLGLPQASLALLDVCCILGCQA